MGCMKGKEKGNILFSCIGKFEELGRGVALCVGLCFFLGISSISSEESFSRGGIAVGRIFVWKVERGILAFEVLVEESSEQVLGGMDLGSIQDLEVELEREEEVLDAQRGVKNKGARRRIDDVFMTYVWFLPEIYKILYVFLKKF